jgi:hypothetical protein
MMGRSWSRAAFVPAVAVPLAGASAIEDWNGKTWAIP